MARIRARSPRLVAGLNVGTSLDGIDVALLEVEGQGLATRFRLLRYATMDLPEGIRKGLLAPDGLGPRALARLDVELGCALATALGAVVKAEGLEPERVDLVGSHGATVWHEPPRHAGTLGASLQIGNAAVLAEKCGAVVVANFRAADIAASGQGAPLMPWLDHLLFHDRPGTLLLNLGGIANLTWVGADQEDVLAFDVGPANLPLNEISRRLSKGEAQYDDGGRMAALGSVDRGLLDWLAEHPFLRIAPPKSTGREEFGEAWTAMVLDRHRHRRLVDILATMTAFVARNVHRAAVDFIAPRPVRRLLVSGGGVHNHSLMHHLKTDFAPVEVESFRYHGFDPDAKEAVLFALLANERVFERPSGIPAATGAMWPALLGQICG
ncbi:MAG: anhydro-N-acetylmuramic acid kinase [Planctomycetes bacterium]|nr:anhydro-N-acetylmuramic acid kinase [Planctomycetota bacterium]